MRDQLVRFQDMMQGRVVSISWLYPSVWLLVYGWKTEERLQDLAEHTGPRVIGQGKKMSEE